jgi:hypothetical protein
MHLDLEIFPNNSRLFLKVFKNKTNARMRYDDDGVNGIIELKQHSDDEKILVFPTIGYTNWQRTCLEIMVCVWDTSVTTWVRLEFT